MMNKKGNMFAGIMVAFMLLMIGFIVVNFFMPEVTQARLDLNCANAGSITDGTKLMCLFVDSTIIYWIILIFSIVGGIIADRIIS